MNQIKRRTLDRIPTEKEISLLLDEGHVVEVYMRCGEVVMETEEAPYRLLGIMMLLAINTYLNCLDEHLPGSTSLFQSEAHVSYYRYTDSQL